MIASDGTEVCKKFKIKKAKKYGVVFHNNDITPMEIVVQILVHSFNISDEEAVKITMLIHTTDKATVYINSKELCQSRLESIDFMKNKLNERNLVVTIEEV